MRVRESYLLELNTLIFWLMLHAGQTNYNWRNFQQNLTAWHMYIWDRRWIDLNIMSALKSRHHLGVLTEALEDLKVQFVQNIKLTSPISHAKIHRGNSSPEIHEVGMGLYVKWYKITESPSFSQLSIFIVCTKCSHFRTYREYLGAGEQHHHDILQIYQ